jgi:hypothetical protein
LTLDWFIEYLSQGLFGHSSQASSAFAYYNTIISGSECSFMRNQALFAYHGRLNLLNS